MSMLHAPTGRPDILMISPPSLDGKGKALNVAGLAKTIGIAAEW